MKRALMLLFLVALTFIPSLLFIGCHKKEMIKPNATIIGVDMRSCVCCGGNFVAVDGEQPVNGTYFLANVPNDADVFSTFPVRVYIEFNKVSEFCENDKIWINKLLKTSI